MGDQRLQLNGIAVNKGDSAAVGIRINDGPQWSVPLEDLQMHGVGGTDRYALESNDSPLSAALNACSCGRLYAR